LTEEPEGGGSWVSELDRRTAEPACNIWLPGCDETWIGEPGYGVG